MLVPGTRWRHGAGATKAAYYPPQSSGGAVGERGAEPTALRLLHQLHRCRHAPGRSGSPGSWRPPATRSPIQAWDFRPGEQLRPPDAAGPRPLPADRRGAVPRPTWTSRPTASASGPPPSPTRPHRARPAAGAGRAGRPCPGCCAPGSTSDLAGLEPEQAAARLLDGLRPGPAEPTTAPAFPGVAGPGQCGAAVSRPPPGDRQPARPQRRLRRPGRPARASCARACTSRGRRRRWCRPRRCMGWAGSARPSWPWSTPTATRPTTT